MSDEPPYNTAECILCGEASIDLEEEAYVALRGAFMQSTEFGVPIFVLDPDTKIRVIQLPNGQLALMTDTSEGPTRHMCKECLHDIAESIGAAPLDPEDALRAAQYDHDYAMDFRRQVEADE